MKIIIGRKTLTREDLFKRKEVFRKTQARLSFEEKIRILINLQKIAYNLGKRKDVIIWGS